MTTATTYQIDPERERVLELTAVPAEMARMGFRRPHVNVVRRWKKRGVRGIALPTVLVGPRLYTSIEALKWWVAAASAAPRCAPGVAAERVRLPMRPDVRRGLEAAGLL